MCDREHFDTLRDRVDRLEDDVKVYHARTDERLKTLFHTCVTAVHPPCAMPSTRRFEDFR